MLVSVVGGGLVGMLSAYELVNAGCSVVLLERGHTGQESSWAGGGILSPLYPWRYPDAITQLVTWGQQQYPLLARLLLSSTGIDPEWVESGMLILEANDIDQAEVWGKKHAKERMVVIPGEEVGCLEPELKGPPIGKAVWDPSVAQLRNPRLLKALRQWLKQAGVEIREQQTVTGFSQNEGCLSAIQTTEGAIAADRCLLAAGAWTGYLLAATGLDLPIRPVRGQMLLLKGRPGLISSMIMKDARYLIPRSDGYILVGSTLEEADFDRSTTDEARQNLWRAAVELVPAIAECEIERQWAGFRPGSPEGVPYIGEHPFVRGLFVSSGHYRNGIVLGPASARLAVDLLLDRTPSWDPALYALNRF